MADVAEVPVADRRDLAGLISQYRRYWPIVTALTLGVMALAGLSTFVMSKRYTATASMMFAPQNASVEKNSAGSLLSDQARDAAIDSQIQMVTTLAVAKRVVTGLRLDKNPVMQAAASRFASNSEERQDAMATVLLQSVKAKRSGQSTIFEISYTDKNPLSAALIANGFADAFLAEQLQQKIAQSKDDALRVNSRLEGLRSQVAQAESAVAKYKAVHGLISASGSTLAEQELFTLNQQLAITKAQQAESEARNAAARQQVSNGSGGADVGDALASPVVLELRKQRAEVARNVADLSALYGPRYPALMKAQDELKDIDSQIQQEVNRILSNLRAQTDVAQRRTSALQGSLASATSRLASNNNAGVQLADLQRDADAARGLYESFLASSKEKAAAQVLVQPDARLAMAATPPLRPSSPNLTLNLFLGLVVGLGLGIAAAYLQHSWSLGIDTIDDIAQRLHQNFLNSLPTLASSIDDPGSTNPFDAVIAHPLSRYAEAFRSLATSLLYSDGAGNVKVIGITSALPKEGKTTTSVCVARVLAMGGSKVILLDADLRRRSVTEALYPEASAGLIEVLSGKMTLAEAVRLDEPSGAMFLPLNKGAHLAKTPFASPPFAALMEQLREEYDVVIIDTAPVLAVVDTRLLLHHFDALALLTHWRTTPVKAIRAAIHQVESVGGSITGVAMTLVNAKLQAQAGYGDPSHYYADMKDYYID